MRISVSSSLAALDRQKKSNNRLLVIVGLVVLLMLGLAYASVPLYRLFCQVTGFGGTTQVATQTPDQSIITGTPISVRLDANVNPQLNWSFAPIRTELSLRPGEDVTAFYRATNIGTEPSIGTANFNVTPQKAGPYFMKLECFCFTEQTLQPGESVDMPVRFFLDKAITSDVNTADVDEIVLSYTFLKVKDKTG